MLERLERIEALERELLAEIESLAPEAAAWARAEGDARAAAAAGRLSARINERGLPP